MIAKRGYDGTHLWTAESDGHIWVTVANDFTDDGIRIRTLGKICRE